MIHKVEYLHPGSLFPEYTTRELTVRDPQLAAAIAPDGAYCFTLYDVPEAPDLGPEFTVTAKRQNESGRFYLGGKIYTLVEIEAMGDDYRILASNISRYEGQRAILCVPGNWQPLRPGDVVL